MTSGCGENHNSKEWDRLSVSDGFFICDIEGWTNCIEHPEILDDFRILNLTLLLYFRTGKEIATQTIPNSSVKCLFYYSGSVEKLKYKEVHLSDLPQDSRIPIK